MIAAAQPTPGFTLSAEKGQFNVHAPHSMQAFMSTISTFPSFTDNTLWGQTRVQIPQPVHFAESSFRVALSFKYLCFIKTSILFKYMLLFANLQTNLQTKYHADQQQYNTQTQ
jgi:hypothetical protein